MSGDIENQTDLELVARFKATRDNRYFAALFDRYQKRIYWIAYSMFGNRVMAEDIVQETFARAFEKIASFYEQNQESNFYAWLCMICRNACLDEGRKARIRIEHQKEVQVSTPSYQSTHSGQLDDAIWDSGHTNFQVQDLAVIFHRVDEELKRMEEGKRTCWLLFYLEGCSYKEIAGKTGLSFEEVKTNIRYVNRYLKRLFT